LAAAYDIQEQAFGGLKPEIRKALTVDSLGSVDRTSARRAKGDPRMIKLMIELAKLRPDVAAEAPGPQVNEARMNSRIDDILARLQEERAEEEAEAEARQKGTALRE
jgi:hypothetical protein